MIVQCQINTEDLYKFISQEENEIMRASFMSTGSNCKRASFMSSGSNCNRISGSSSVSSSMVRNSIESMNCSIVSSDMKEDNGRINRTGRRKSIEYIYKNKVLRRRDSLEHTGNDLIETFVPRSEQEVITATPDSQEEAEYCYVMNVMRRRDSLEHTGNDLIETFVPRSEQGATATPDRQEEAEYCYVKNVMRRRDSLEHNGSELISGWSSNIPAQTTQTEPEPNSATTSNEITRPQTFKVQRRQSRRTSTLSKLANWVNKSNSLTRSKKRASMVSR